MEFFILIGVFLINGLILFLVFRLGGNDTVKLISESVEKSAGRTEALVRQEMSVGRRESAETGDRARKEIADALDRFSRVLGDLIDRNEAKINEVKKSVESRLESIQKDNSEKLEKMRETVDEKLHATLERRLGESFKRVDERLELVHKGLGEMQTLATGVGDLKKVLQNVKTRGTWGEVQLEMLLNDILTPEQYVKNVVTKKGSNDRVEFAIRIPAKNENMRTIFLPIDAKFPLEDYQGLVDASEKGDISEVDRFSKALENRIKMEAKDIMTKYLDPPYTTDFGILFLPNEGLYAEVLRRSGLSDILRKQYRVIITGPTTIAAILNSLQMGFRTLAITRRSSEVWEVLGSIKKEFVVFGDILEKTQKKLQEASNTIETASRKSRTIERKLGKVQELPESDKGETIPLIKGKGEDVEL